MIIEMQNYKNKSYIPTPEEVPVADISNIGCEDGVIERVSYIMPLMYFKNLYDSEFYINPFDESIATQPKYTVAYNIAKSEFEPLIVFDTIRLSDVFFSSMEMAQACAAWATTEFTRNGLIKK